MTKEEWMKEVTRIFYEVYDIRTDVPYLSKWDDYFDCGYTPQRAVEENVVCP